MVNDTITREYHWGLDDIPQRYAGMFRFPFEELLEKNIGQRKQWVKQILLLREQFGGVIEADASRAFLRNWLIKRERR